MQSKVFIFLYVFLMLFDDLPALTCYGGLNEYLSDENILLENTFYTCGNNSDWDEIIQEGSEWFCMKAVQSQLDQTILEYGCAQGCLPTISIFNDISKQLYCCSTDLCNKVPNLHKTNGKYQLLSLLTIYCIIKII